MARRDYSQTPHVPDGSWDVERRFEAALDGRERRRRQGPEALCELRAVERCDLMTDRDTRARETTDACRERDRCWTAPRLRF